MGADWPLVQDAIIIATLALGGGIGLTVLALKLRDRKRRPPARQAHAPRGETRTSPEDRVRVLERIATDRPTQLAAEIEALRNEEMETN
ncbi:hypothetical protein CP97_11755 [Aurantiacibacter atlanticus]|uniref:Uncharacterized protein n=1 Tax=Aurantiacibacter atlanticus TaxID=1648404 RepID=A0A0H4VHY0_9SPHN|nr:hypothetical protein [Aurantiacibacter atlanticus]AKQ42564.1 hypothetical protein CP97_11755 [Aurantiacibacter atlanticus]MDF1835518.1 hypothetical protein [Alteraurantiacibacter sp. bin_em_oilr2.035]